MKKQLILTSAMAATLSACASNDDWGGQVLADDDTQICVDGDGNRVSDIVCDGDHDGGGYYGGFYGKKYRKYYVSRSSPVPYIGDSVRDSRYGFRGSYVPASGVAYASAPSATQVSRSEATSRGGLGSSSRSYGGGRS